jgi:hypothetical protein
MTTFNRDHEDVLAQLSEWAIRSSVETLKHEDRLTIGLREALRNGASINDLSAISGLTPSEIRRRVNRELNVLSELELLSG